MNAILRLFAFSFVCSLPLSGQDAGQPPLTDAGKKLEAQYADQFEKLRTELTAKIPKQGQANGEKLDQFLANEALDAQLVQFVVLHEATPRGLAEFAQQGRDQWSLVESLLANTDLMKQMLVADGAKAPKMGRNGYGPAQYGPAIQIYSNIQKTSDKASAGVLQRLAVATSLEHAVPIAQANPEAATDAPATVDPVKRYLHFEKAHLGGELDSTFDQLSTWDLRMVVDGDEPDETLTWGREMLRNYRPDHIYNSNFGWRYVNIVTSDVKYGSQDVKHDRPELQKYQNMLMNGGVCGRRAFFGRFILRSFGVPTTARPSRGHAALAHWTPDGWVVNLGGGWGAGWTKTRYDKDTDFLASTQARINREAFLKVKRAQWIGDVLGETRTYGENAKTPPAFWNEVSLKTQRSIIKESKAVTLAALGEDLGEANEPTVAEKVMASPVTPADKEITVGDNGKISIPAAAYTKPKGNTRDVLAMKSFDGGLQIFLPRFFPQGQTIMRGGTWKGDADALASGSRMLSGGYGRYENWGLRAALTPPGGKKTPAEVTLDLGDGVKMEMVYIKPGTFIMGGESETDGRFQCVEVPKHEVQLTKGFYLGKYEVTQAQYAAMVGSNPSKSTKAPDCPVDNVGEADALSFCGKVAAKTGLEVRLPTEAEWEYASRAGSDAKWFFGDDPSPIGDYAWFKDNAGGKSHPVGQKKPNPFGLYDIYGNVNERIADKYDRSYYSKSPRVDPTGPSPGTKSHLEYTVTVPKAGNYALTAQVVTANYGQRICVSTNGSDSENVLEMPFTVGKWQKSEPVTIALKEGENTLNFWRNEPPQYGLAIKEFTLTPVR
ncbi:MAG: SUMF1/EgtB/PvdO family nonheme iron enzyme [Verrucomicrobiales bacterium]|nr:SUMF1/EgtB/PvdO family nonheme iron enzyme [Verrucomicrobiales bacterium]